MVRRDVLLLLVACAQYDVHRYNFSDVPIWDRLFGTYRDTTEFTPRCGFPWGAEQRLVAMLMFKDVYHEAEDAPP